MAKIVVRGSKATVEHTGWPYRPEGMTSAQLNLSYCVATLLLEGDVFVDQFSESMVADEKRMSLAKKVSVVEDPAITALGSKFRHKVHVAVHLNDGSVLEETVESPRGSEKHFASPNDITAKFEKLAGRVFAKQQRERIVDLVLNLDRLPDAGALVKALQKPSP